MAVSGKGLAYTTAGFALAWSGIKGQTLKTTLTDLLKGQNPPAAQEAAPGLGIASGAGAGTTAPETAGGTYDSAAIEALWTASGGNPARASVAACIAMHESSGNPQAESSNPDGGTNVGLWQLDTKGKGAGYSVAQLMDPGTNARVAIMGSSNGTDWSAWSTAPMCGV
jgi:hypothetical protein